MNQATDKKTDLENTLYQAVIEGDLDVVKSAIEAGASVNIKVKADYSTNLVSLLYCAINEWQGIGTDSLDGNRPDIVKVLVAAGADCKRELKANIRGGFSLLEATQKEFLTKLFIEAMPLKNLSKIIHLAVEYEDLAAVTALLKKGIDPNELNENAYTALHMAAHYNLPSIITALAKGDAVVGAGDCNGNSALHIAVSQGNHEALQALVNCNADINAHNCYGDTALHIALLQGHSRIADYLKAKGAR